MKPSEQVGSFTISFEGGRAAYMFAHWGFCTSFTRKESPWFVPIRGIVDSRDHQDRWYFLHRDWTAYDRHLDRFVADASLLQHIVESHNTEHARLTAFLKQRSDATLDVQNLRDVLTEFFNRYPNLFFLASNLRWIDRAIVPRLRALAPRGEEDTFVRVLSAPTEQTATVREEDNVLEVACRVRGGALTEPQQIDAALEGIWRRFAWISCGYYNEPAKTLDTYHDWLRRLLAGDPESRRAEVRKHRESLQAEREKLLVQLDARGRRLAELAAASAHLKDYFKFTVNEALYRIDPFLCEAARRADLASDFIKDLLPEEVLVLLRGDALDRERIEARIRHHVIVVVDSEVEVLSGTAADHVAAQYLDSVPADEKHEFHGRGASPGRGRGVACVVLGPHDFSKFRDGSVLVAVNTSPDFVPLMRKAVAIVAEEGGITAHVSVVSREFGIPCVVGITRATELLHDGDEVEVDAEKGMVRVLKRA